MKALTVLSDCNMIDPDLDWELSIANEFVLEAIKAESVNNQMEFTSISKSSKPNCRAGLEYIGRCSENDTGCFFQTSNDDQSLSTLDSMPEQLEEKVFCSANDQKNYRLVPDISVNQSTAICCESNPSDACSLWNINNSYFPRQTVSCLIKSETSTSCYFSLPNIIDSMNRVDLLDLDSFHISDNLPFSIKEEPMEEDIRVDFLNIKDVYLQHAEGIEDSFLCVYVKTRCKLNGVKLFLKRFQEGVPGHCSQGPIRLPSEYNRRTGMISVDLNCLSLYLPPTSETTECLESKASTFWQFIVKVQLEDGRSVGHFSKAFQIRRKIQEYEDEKEFKRKQKKIPVTRIDDSTIDFPSSIYSWNTEEISESMPKSCALEGIRNSKYQPFTCQNTMFSDDTTSDDVLRYGTKKIVLAPGSTLDKSVISTKIQDEKDIVSIQEQINFAGLLKVMKTNHLQDTSRRKANGYRSAEEAFVWACGHCFFSRGKKSTVKSHVIRQVCQKRRRMLSECNIKQEKTAKPKFRRCHTFNGSQSKPMRNYSLKRCKTP